MVTGSTGGAVGICSSLTMGKEVRVDRGRFLPLLSRLLEPTMVGEGGVANAAAAVAPNGPGAVASDIMSAVGGPGW